MNYFKTERFTDQDYIDMRSLYYKALKKNADLQRYCATLERRLTVRSIVDKRKKKTTSAV